MWSRFTLLGRPNNLSSLFRKKRGGLGLKRVRQQEEVVAVTDLWKKLLPDWLKWRPDAEWVWFLVGGIVGVIIAWIFAAFAEGEGSYPTLKFLMIVAGGAAGGATGEALRQKNQSLATIYAAGGAVIIGALGTLMWVLRLIFG